MRLRRDPGIVTPSMAPEEGEATLPNVAHRWRELTERQNAVSRRQPETALEPCDECTISCAETHLSASHGKPLQTAVALKG